MILVWDTTVSTPVKTIFDPHDGAGVIAMEMTQDAMYLVTLGAGETADICFNIAPWSTRLHDLTP